MKKICIRIAVCVFWIALWQGAAILLNQPLFLPTPIAVFKTGIRLFSDVEAWLSSFFSLLRVLEGYLIGMVLGIIAAVAAYRFRYFDALFSPVMTVIRSTPVASFIMLFWLILGAGRIPSAISVLMVFPLAYTGILAAIRSLSRDLSEVCKLYRMPLRRRISLYYFPDIMPTFAPSAVNALGLSWKAGIAAEVMAHTSVSIGNEIYLAKSYLEVETLYAWTVAVILLSLILENGVRLLLRRYLKGEKHVT